MKGKVGVLGLAKVFTTKRLFSSLPNVDITTYNVLSSHLAEEDYFTSCSPAALASSNRLTKLQSKLEERINANSIICLQEVSNLWAGSLHSYFSKRDYHFITAPYGNKFDGYMGVAIAVPVKYYDIVDSSIVRASDTKSWPREERARINPIMQLIKSTPFLSNIFQKFYPEPPPSAWEAASKRFNQLITVKLEPKQHNSNSRIRKNEDNSFVVGTYHMPCMFRTPAAMMIHCALAGQYIQQYAASSPYILAGDFNIKPQDAMYKLMTEGTVSSEDPAFPKRDPNDTSNWQCSVEPMRSAYKTLLGQEPDFTNWAKIREEPDFIDTLDYIFISPQWNVHEVANLPNRSQLKGPLPILAEPSDHLLLSAKLSVGRQ